MPGPPPTPLHLRLLKGNPGKRPVRAEPEREPERPAPPAFVTGYAADEWWRVAPELWRLGLLRVTDIMSLSAYCLAYHHWRMAEEAFARMAEHDGTMHGLLVKSAVGDARRNPLVKVGRRGIRHDPVRRGVRPHACRPQPPRSRPHCPTNLTAFWAERGRTCTHTLQ